MSHDPLRNKKDPLREQVDAERELFTALGRMTTGYTCEQVAAVAVNLLVNALRQKHAKRQEAEKAFNELVARGRDILLDKHYDALGNRRSVFPFHQTIEMKTADFRSKMQ